MKVIAVAAISLDGKISDAQDQKIGASSEDMVYFKKVTKQAGVVILGRRTSDTFKASLRDRLNVVYTNQPKLLDQPADQRVWYTNQPPDFVLKKLTQRGFKEAALIGGEQIFTLFNKAGLVDEWHLTICPQLLPGGLPLLRDHLATKFEVVNREVWDSGETLLMLK